MNPIPFKEANCMLGIKDGKPQEGVESLPACKVIVNEKTRLYCFVTVFALTPEEKEEIAKTGLLVHYQYASDGGPQPFSMAVSPANNPIVETSVPEQPKNLSADEKTV